MTMNEERPTLSDLAEYEDDYYILDIYCEGCGLPHEHCECAAREEPQCRTPGCNGPVENQYGTCDECQDDAYQGDAFNVW